MATAEMKFAATIFPRVWRGAGCVVGACGGLAQPAWRTSKEDSSLTCGTSLEACSDGFVPWPRCRFGHDAARLGSGDGILGLYRILTTSRWRRS